MATKAKTVLYHAPFALPKAFQVLKEHKDGLVDIGQADGLVIVRGCKITAEPTHGSATLEPEAEALEKESTAEASIKQELEAQTRDQLVSQVLDYNVNAPADKKIAIAPTVSKTELVEKLLAVLVATEN